MTLYDVSSYVLWAVFGVIAIISIIFLTGHGVNLIAGYNTASKEEKKNIMQKSCVIVWE
jgi:hypothetical protein